MFVKQTIYKLVFDFVHDIDEKGQTKEGMQPCWLPEQHLPDLLKVKGQKHKII